MRDHLVKENRLTTTDIYKAVEDAVEDGHLLLDGASSTVSLPLEPPSPRNSGILVPRSWQRAVIPEPFLPPTLPTLNDTRQSIRPVVSSDESPALRNSAGPSARSPLHVMSDTESVPPSTKPSTTGISPLIPSLTVSTSGHAKQSSGENKAVLIGLTEESKDDDDHAVAPVAAWRPPLPKENAPVEKPPLPPGPPPTPTVGSNSGSTNRRTNT